MRCCDHCEESRRAHGERMAAVKRAKMDPQNGLPIDQIEFNAGAAARADDAVYCFDRSRFAAERAAAALSRARGHISRRMSVVIQRDVMRDALGIATRELEEIYATYEQAVTSLNALCDFLDEAAPE